MSAYCLNCMEPIGAGSPITHLSAANTSDAVCDRCGCDIASARNAPHQLPAGTVLANGRYLVGHVLGQGGFGITYIGRDLTLDMRVAVKEYYPTSSVGRNCDSSCEVTPLNDNARRRLETGRQRFLEEARVLAKFHNTPGIVDVRDFFEQNGTAYIVMDYLEGETLKSHLEHGPIDADRTFELMQPIVDALSLVHDDHVIHRDISPDNIMLCSDGSLRLMDFGAAREMDFGDQRTMSMVLKSGYAPEEQYRAKGELGPWTDIYALCATIYRAIAGVAPDESLQRLIADDMKWPSEMGVHISPAQEAVLRKGMAPRSTERYRSIAEMKADLMPRVAAPADSASGDGTGADCDDELRQTAGVLEGHALQGQTAQAIALGLEQGGEPQTNAEVQQEEKPERNEEPQREREAQQEHVRQTRERIEPRKAAAIAAIAICIVGVLAATFFLMPAFTVSFDANGGNTAEPIQLNRIATLDEPAAPTRDGYEFAGWYLDDSLTDKAEFPLAVHSDVTLHAAWNKIRASYRIEYVDATDESQVSKAKVVEDAEVGAEITETAPEIEGYALDSDQQVKLTISENDSDNVASFSYRKLVSYEVRYRDKATDADIAPVKTVDNVAEGTEVTETAPDVAGYTLQSDKVQAITLKRDAAENVITFTYDAIQYEPIASETGGGSGGGNKSKSSNDVEWAN